MPYQPYMKPEREPDTEIEFHGEGHTSPAWICDICGEASYQPIWAHSNAVCARCASIIANVWSHNHSGQYITWPNPKRASRPKPVTQKVRKMVMKRDDYRCRYCGDYRDITLDHVVPVCQGGGNEAENLVAACRPCNGRKHGRTPGEAGMTIKPLT